MCRNTTILLRCIQTLILPVGNSSAHRRMNLRARDLARATAGILARCRKTIKAILRRTVFSSRGNFGRSLARMRRNHSRSHIISIRHGFSSVGAIVTENQTDLLERLFYKGFSHLARLHQSTSGEAV